MYLSITPTCNRPSHRSIKINLVTVLMRHQRQFWITHRTTTYKKDPYGVLQLSFRSSPLFITWSTHSHLLFWANSCADSVSTYPKPIFGSVSDRQQMLQVVVFTWGGWIIYGKAKRTIARYVPKDLERGRGQTLGGFLLQTSRWTVVKRKSYMFEHQLHWTGWGETQLKLCEICISCYSVGYRPNRCLNL